MRLIFAVLLMGLMSFPSTYAYPATVTYVYTDTLGTPLAEADANGNIIATFEYRPYGAQILGTAPNGPGYTGHVNDPETGLIYMQARYYDTETGRFLSLDPKRSNAGNPFDFNRFSYVNNNPIINVDPDGTTCARSDPSTSYECHVDRNDGKFTDKQIQMVNKAYSDAVNKLSSHPNATVVVTVKGVSFKANAGKVALSLVGATVATAPESSTARALTLGGGLGSSSKYHLDYTPQTTIFKNAITTDRSGGMANIQADLARTFVHEGIHMLPGEQALWDVYRANPTGFETIHRDRYNAAGNALYEGGK
jgi:RHS repeat-associated protein